jgi:nucleoid-associated protein YgaU
MLQKARIVEEPTGPEVAFQFNPETISFTKAARWTENPTQAGTDAPVRQYTGTDPLELTLKMILDEATSTGPTVADRVNRLLKWTNPTGGEGSGPHTLRFEWGQLKIGVAERFRCSCDSVAVEYTLFTPAGVPLRATATVKLKGLPTTREGQNPTSGGVDAVRSRTVGRGDDLAVLVHREYGSTRHWRRIAELNGIDNPFRLPAGRELLFPSRPELGS